MTDAATWVDPTSSKQLLIGVGFSRIQWNNTAQLSATTGDQLDSQEFHQQHVTTYLGSNSDEALASARSKHITRIAESTGSRATFSPLYFLMSLIERELFDVNSLDPVTVLLESPEKPSPSQHGDENQQDDYHNEDDSPRSPHSSPSSGSTYTPHLTNPRKILPPDWI